MLRAAAGVYPLPQVESAFRIAPSPDGSDRGAPVGEERREIKGARDVLCRGPDRAGGVSGCGGVVAPALGAVAAELGVAGEAVGRLGTRAVDRHRTGNATCSAQAHIGGGRVETH